MRKVKSTDVRLRHKRTGLFLLVENEGRPSENDVYGAGNDASVFKDRAAAGKVAKRLGLQRSEFEIA